MLFINLNTHATYLVCDGGKQIWIGENDSEKGRGDDFALEFFEGANYGKLYNLPFCKRGQSSVNISDSSVNIACNYSDGESIENGSIEVSRMSGLYSYSMRIKFQGTIIAWWIQDGKCSIAKTKLF
ncbi:hypothetical protein OAM53_00690 [Candidatus Thioglobus sp.]|nr:hypothetical protein [Candidatus Thioglobus sp.]